MIFLQRTKRAKGVLSLDSAFAIAVIIFLTTYVTAKTEPLAKKSEEQIVVDGILHIIEGAESYRMTTNNGFNGMEIEDLQNYVNSKYSQWEGGPSSGSFTVSSSTSDRYLLRYYGYSSKVCEGVAVKLGKFLNATCAGSTVRVLVNDHNT